jgi:PAS domain S-box-containing protein
MPNPLPHVLASDTLRHLEQLIGEVTAGVILLDLTGTILWANEAALAMHGVSKLDELGGDADRYAQLFALRLRNGHRLARREYPVMRVLAGESFPDLIVEVAAAGGDGPRWTHHVRDVVLTGADDEPDCVALVLQDVSEQFEAEARFEALFQANPAPALIMRLSDQRYARANRGFLEMTGYSAPAIAGKSLYDFDVLNKAERVEFARQRLAEGRTIPQMEAELPMPDGHTKLVIVAGQPIEVGDDRCMLFTFADLEPRRRAERALRASEAHFATLFQMAPVAMVLTSPDSHRTIDVNEAFVRLTGRSSAGSIGRIAGDPELWADPAQREEVQHELDQSGGVRNRDVRLIHADGHPVDCLLSAERMEIRGERCTLWLYQDISLRRHSELELADAIEAVMKDASWFSSSVLDKLANLRNPGVSGSAMGPVDLSFREREVLGLICEGLDDKAIAERLTLSGNTVRNHVAKIYGKTGVNRRAAVVAWARERGLT